MVPVVDLVVPVVDLVLSVVGLVLVVPVDSRSQHAYGNGLILDDGSGLEHEVYRNLSDGKL